MIHRFFIFFAAVWHVFSAEIGLKSNSEKARKWRFCQMLLCADLY